MSKRWKTLFVSLIEVSPSGSVTEKDKLRFTRMGILTYVLPFVFIILLEKGMLPIENSCVAAVLGAVIIYGIMFLINFIRIKIIRKIREKEQ